MLTHYFSDPVMLDLIQRTPAAAYLDCLSAELVATGYKPTTIQRYLRSAAHVSYWQRLRGRSLTELDPVCIEELGLCLCGERPPPRCAPGLRNVPRGRQQKSFSTHAAPR